MDSKLILLIIIAVLGLFLTGKGITGFAVMSQTCCFPSEDCSPENMCDSLKPEYKNELTLDFFSTLAGAVIFISSIILIQKHLHKKGIR
jgi:hypothetical protein